MRFQKAIRQEINTGLFNIELDSPPDFSEAFEITKIFYYTNKELDIDFTQERNALWAVKDSHQVSGYVPIRENEFFCYLLALADLIFCKAISDSEILKTYFYYLKFHPFGDYSENFKTFVNKLGYTF